MHASERQLKLLMVLGLDGDAVAYRALIGGLASLLRTYFGYRLGGGGADVEDLIQEVLIAVHSRVGTYDRNQPFTPWAHAIARYKLVDYYRWRRLRVTSPIDDAGDVFVEDASDAADARADLERLMAGLPIKQRAAIRCTRLEGLSVAETGERLGMSASAVKVSVHRGLKALTSRVQGMQ